MAGRRHSAAGRSHIFAPSSRTQGRYLPPMRRALDIPAFRRLAVGATLNDLALLIGEIALALLVYRRTGSAIGTTAFFLCAQFGPAFLSLLLVTRLDQGSVRLALALIYALEALIFFVLGQFVESLPVGAVLLLALAQGSLAVTARVLSRAAWTAIGTEAGVLRETNAVMNSAASVCWLVGPALGGALVAAAGTRMPLFVNVAVFVMCTFAVLTAPGLPQTVPDRAPALSRIRSAVIYARRERFVRRLLSLQGVFMIFFTISIPVEVVFARHVLHAGASGYGLLLSAWGGGAIAGSVMFARWRALSSRLLMALGAALVGAGFLPMALAPDLAVAVAGAAIAGVGNGIEIVAMRTALQEAAPARSMSLILGLNETMFQAVPGIGIVVGGLVATVAGPRAALGTAAAGSLLVAMAMWIALPLAGAERAGSAGAAHPEGAEQRLTVAAPRD